MKLINIDFTQNPKLLIDGIEYNFNHKFSATDHIFNNAGSSLSLKDIFPLSYTDNDLMNKPFKIPKYSLVEIYFGSELFYFGILKVQKSGSLNINRLKKIDITIASLKEFLVHEPMDFPIINKNPEFVIDKIIQKLNIPYVGKGKISFTNNQIIKSYNTKDMSAYDTLRYVGRHTNSTLFIDFNNSKKMIEISFQSNSSISNNATGNIGVPITFDTDANAKTFSDLYEIESIEWEENSNKDANTIRVESEKSLSSRSRDIQVDLSTNQTKFTTPFPIGKLNKLGVKYVDSAGNVIRKLSVTSQEQADAGKPSDIAYTQNGNSITINQRLIDKAPNGKVIISYFPLIRQNVDFEDVPDQARISKQLKTPKGKLFRYEKYNDVTELDDLISQGKSLLEIGLASKLELKITTRKPIWDLGQYVEFTGTDYYKEFVGEYVIKDVNVEFIVDSLSGLKFGIFKYTLANLKQVETAFNYQDSQVYRDNPIVEIEDISIDTSTTVSESVLIESKNLVKTCVVDEKITQFDYNLDMAIGYKSKARFKVLKI